MRSAIRSAIRPDDIGVCTSVLLADPMACGPDDLEPALRAAAGAGFRAVTVWGMHATATGVELTRDLVDELGLTVRIAETVGRWADGPEVAAADAEAQLDVVEALGADMMLASANPRSLDVGRAADGFAALCDAAGRRGIRVTVEFVPPRAMCNLATAWEIVRTSGADNGGLLLDVMHWQYQPGGPDLDLLRQIPGAYIHTVQLCDAPTPTLPFDRYSSVALKARPLPGEGIADIDGMLDALDAIGAAPFFTFEVFNQAALEKGGPSMAAWLRESAKSFCG